MKRGKHVCRILKDIRKQIAQANDIELITSECQYHGDCPGTCPKCEAEVHYLEQQLAYRQIAGKAITLLGLSTGAIAVASLTSCAHSGNNNPPQEVAADTTEQLMIGEPVATVPNDSVRMDTLIKTVKAPPRLPEVVEVDIVEGLAIEGDIAYVPVVEDTLREDTFAIAEQMPEFPGGQQELMKFITQNIDYGPIYQGNGTQGRVIVQFVVDKEGNVVNPTVVRGVDPYLDKEALRIINLMPKWKPGTQKGQPVAVKYVVPVMFRLQ